MFMLQIDWLTTAHVCVQWEPLHGEECNFGIGTIGSHPIYILCKYSNFLTLHWVCASGCGIPKIPDAGTSSLTHRYVGLIQGLGCGCWWWVWFAQKSKGNENGGFLPKTGCDLIVCKRSYFLYSCHICKSWFILLLECIDASDPLINYCPRGRPVGTAAW